MKRLFNYKNQPKIIGVSSICGPKEAQSNFAKYFELKLKDDKYYEETFEKAESKMMYTVIKNAITNSGKKETDIDSIFSGDLLNQIMSSSFSARNFDCGYFGIYNACATFCEGLILASSLIDSNYQDNIVCATTSHFSTAERQYRYPLELGSTRPPVSQWTVTGGGAVVLSNKGNYPKIMQGFVGRVIDYGVIDANNMGAAMAPSAFDTLYSFFKETNTTPNEYDLILTGDLGVLGGKLFRDLMWEKGYNIKKQHVDLGEIIYNSNDEEYQGGSGAGCSSLMFCSYFYNAIKERKYKKVILMTTGALLSSISSFQGESIPSITHLVVIGCGA